MEFGKQQHHGGKCRKYPGEGAQDNSIPHWGTGDAPHAGLAVLAGQISAPALSRTPALSTHGRSTSRF